MTKLRTLLLATATVIVSAATVQAADRHYHWQPSRAPILIDPVAGMRGATPLTVPFYAHGWYPGPAYYHDRRQHSCCAPGSVISVRY